MREKRRLTTSAISTILKNEIYKGDRLIQKQPPRNLMTHKPDFTREYVSYYVSKNHEPIINPELWEQAQIVRNTPKDPGTFSNKRSHPLKGILICGECGSRQGIKKVYIFRDGWKLQGENRHCEGGLTVTEFLVPG